jgi:hypothetical protein
VDAAEVKQTSSSGDASSVDKLLAIFKEKHRMETGLEDEVDVTMLRVAKEMKTAKFTYLCFQGRVLDGVMFIAT